jgi:hypothetical protein
VKTRFQSMKKLKLIVFIKNLTFRVEIYILKNALRFCTGLLKLKTLKVWLLNLFITHFSN